MAAIAFSAPATGRIRAPERWWFGGATRPAFVIVTAAGTGIAAAIISIAMPPTVALPSYWIFAVIGVGLAIIDVRCRRLPHCLTAVLWTSSGVTFIAAALIDGDGGPLVRATSAGIATAIIMLAVALALPGQLGLGDVAFAGTITFSLGWLGWQAACLGLLAGLFLQGAAAATRRRQRDSDGLTPMGPALLAGWLLAVALSS
ncbi:prepilin peptidase [Salinispora arenicola]|nr:prepilin peptidase [Salinispora arenicola]